MDVVQPAAGGEHALVAALRKGDEAAFGELVARHHRSMVRVASCYVSTPAVAEEVVQETWLAVIEGLDRFEERSSLRTWMFHILVNRARTRGVREHRSVPVSSLTARDVDDDDEAVSLDRFRGGGDRWAGHWADPPHLWSDLPGERLVGAETRSVVEAAVAGLPDSQREVVTLRDIDGWSAEEVCELLGISEGNQRVLLHRGRSKVRAALERYFAKAGGR